MVRSVSFVRVVFLFCLVLFVWRFLYGFFGWYVPYRLILCAGSTLAGLIIFATHLIDPLTSFVGGVLSDIVGRKFVIVISLIFYACAALLLVFHSVLWSIVIALAIILLIVESTAIASPALPALLADNVPQDYLGRAYAKCSIAALAGAATGASLLVTLLNVDKTLFILTVLTLCIVSAIALVPLRETRQIYEKSCSAEGFSVGFRSLLGSVKEFWRERPDLLCLALANAIGQGLAGTYLAAYVTETRHIGEVLVGFAYTCMIVGQGITRYVISHVLDKKPEIVRTLILAGTFTMGLSWLILVYSPGLYVIIPFVISGIVSQLFAVATGLLLLRTASPEARGTIFGTFQTIYNTVYTIAIPLGGLVYSIDKNLPIIIISAITLTTPILEQLILKQQLHNNRNS